MTLDTITAISSGRNVNQPIGIVRMSGADAIKILSKVFKGKIVDPKQEKGISYGYIYDKNQLVDEVLVMFYYGNKTYTGETMVEINCHGGHVVTNWILELLIENGARLAKNGEFSERAFFNKKIDLTKADAIHDLIMAKTKSQVLLSANKFTQGTYHFLSKIISELELYIGNLEANIDYPEYEDIEDINNIKFLEILKDIAKKLEVLVTKSERNIKLFEGIKILILGKPNVGKSSLLNALKKEDKAIVTDIAGTTRDIIETEIQINNILFKIIDTAGIRKARNKIEEIGINKGLDLIPKSDVIIHLIDERKKDEFDNKIVELALKNNKKCIEVLNKNDIIKSKKSVIKISAINNDVEELENALIKDLKDINFNDDDTTNNVRQLSLIKKSLNHINEAIVAMQNMQTADVIIIDVVAAWEALKEVTGQVNREELIDAIFRNFCLGK
ncbi:tRNA modification GTPase TrmE [Mycoplasmopsis californica]|uniref:tRNA modification GTPase MnmE n=1 Tax=Mycoplasmopsis equigenitalium TaxID=114883 RepID=A0ABY5J1H8_9BACT|nr:tRNA uridine-5-carboxymethylaminomethyl(34) synthesis GTPase MnmE [Mycoplasmopsis equigenitalium]UUD37069.1 tRNA uridine-5-carboxymethylaminomethyl(34) synthesis GTPase MnmE [Mycoplasmopsis equigenitalium]VEU69630.1 tRNA modification GTPase TrmE [Mycoplasmopsis californica]